MPGVLAEQLQDIDLDSDMRTAMESAPVIHSGRGYYLRITAPLAVHAAFLDQYWIRAEALGGIYRTTAERQAYRRYAQRVDDAKREDRKSDEAVAKLETAIRIDREADTGDEEGNP